MDDVVEVGMRTEPQVRGFELPAYNSVSCAYHGGRRDTDKIEVIDLVID